MEDNFFMDGEAGKQGGRTGQGAQTGMASPAAPLLLCCLVPNRLLTHTGPGPGSGTPALRNLHSKGQEKPLEDFSLGVR